MNKAQVRPAAGDYRFFNPPRGRALSRIIYLKCRPEIQPFYNATTNIITITITTTAAAAATITPTYLLLDC